MRGIKTRLGQLQSLLLTATNAYPSLLCGFRFEFEFFGDCPITTCHDIMVNYRMDGDGVPDGAVIMKRVTPEEYVTQLRSLIGEVMEKGLTIGSTDSAPNILQQRWMTVLQNSASYLFMKWSRLLVNERLEEEQEKIRQQEDGIDNEAEIEEIKKVMATRTAAKNKQWHIDEWWVQKGV